MATERQINKKTYDYEFENHRSSKLLKSINDKCGKHCGRMRTVETTGNCTTFSERCSAITMPVRKPTCDFMLANTCVFKLVLIELFPLAVIIGSRGIIPIGVLEFSSWVLPERAKNL